MRHSSASSANGLCVRRADKLCGCAYRHYGLFRHVEINALNLNMPAEARGQITVPANK
jgi:hypothetical protein